jgi:hypothetical protein
MRENEVVKKFKKHAIGLMKDEAEVHGWSISTLIKRRTRLLKQTIYAALGGDMRLTTFFEFCKVVGLKPSEVMRGFFDDVINAG